MSVSKSRADDLLETWTAATTRRVPAFTPPAPGRPRTAKAGLLAIAIVLLMSAALGVVAIGGVLDRKDPATSPKDVAAGAADAIAAAPGVRFSLAIDARDPEGIRGIHASGTIDFERGRFAGSADAGGGGALMLFFGGPSSGSVVIADGLFVRTEGDPWERVPGQSTQLDGLIDRARLSNAFRRAVTSSLVDPEIRFSPCPAGTCQVVHLLVPAEALFALTVDMFGQGASAPPPDLGPVNVELLIDSATGFPVRLDTRITAGATITVVTLELTRLDPAPTIDQPIP
jgi:hypothetical protein